MRKLTVYIEYCAECEYFDRDYMPRMCALSEKEIAEEDEFVMPEWCELEKV